MSTSHRFALHGAAPAEWNRPGHLPETQVAFCVRNDGQEGSEGVILEVYAKAFREKLLSGRAQWIFVAHVVREDADLYFAFESPLERALFLELRELDSVGPKTAAQILGGVGTARLADLAHGQSLAGVKIAGVGPKTLEKLGAGIKSRKARFLELLGGPRPQGASLAREESESTIPLPMDLVQGLEKLGLRRDDIQRVYRDLLDADANFAQASASDQIRFVLQRWGQYRAKVQRVSAEG